MDGLSLWTITIPNDSEMQWLPCTYLLHCAVCFWHSASCRSRESNNCGDIPNGLILFNFSVFLLLPDPDHILPHCGEGNILQWAERFRALIVGKAERLWLKRLKVKYYNVFCYTAVLFSRIFTVNSSFSSQIKVKVSNISLVLT